MKKRMTYLEEIDRKDREDGTPRLQYLSSIENIAFGFLDAEKEAYEI